MRITETGDAQVVSRPAEAVVIAVHGTGASNVNDSGDLWWQNGSGFETDLLKAIPHNVTFEPPFHWSGANRESSRLRAGHELYTRLKQLDEAYESRGRDLSESNRQRLGYHLIGHSHGGVVIWHALRISVRRENELKYLRSWATMGTPYLHFTVVRFPWFVLISLVLSFLATGIVTDASGALREWSQVAIATSSWVLAGWIFLSLVPLALLLLAAIRFADWLWGVIDYKLDQTANQAVFNRYGSRFACLWHPYDEPTGGLRATMLPRYPITYQRPSRGELQLVRRIYNGTVSRVADDLVWGLVMRKLQGSDRRVRLLHRVERTPPCFPLTNLLPVASARAIDQMVKLQTTSTAANLRSRLASLASYRSSIRAVRSLGKEITWREIVHNCYYRDANVIRALGAHISGALVQTNSIQDDAESVRQPPFQSRSIPVAAAIVAVSLALVLRVPARLVYSAVIFPLTNEAQVEIIAEAMKEPEISSVDYRQKGIGGELSEAILLLTEAGHTTTTAELWPVLSSPSTRSVVAERLAHDFAFRGMDAALAELLAAVKEKAPENKPLLASVYANAFLGSLASGRDPARDVLEFVAMTNGAIGCHENYACVRGELAFTVEMAWLRPGAC